MFNINQRVGNNKSMWCNPAIFLILSIVALLAGQVFLTALKYSDHETPEQTFWLFFGAYFHLGMVKGTYWFHIFLPQCIVVLDAHVFCFWILVFSVFHIGDHDKKYTGGLAAWDKANDTIRFRGILWNVATVASVACAIIAIMSKKQSIFLILAGVLQVASILVWELESPFRMTNEDAKDNPGAFVLYKTFFSVYPCVIILNGINALGFLFMGCGNQRK